MEEATQNTAQNPLTAQSLLTPEGEAAAQRMGLAVGFDGDNCAIQQVHVCWPHALFFGALCGSPHLWFQGNVPGKGINGLGEPTHGPAVTCAACIQRLDILMQQDAQLQTALGNFATFFGLLQNIEGAAADFIHVVEKEDILHGCTTIPEAKAALAEAVKEVQGTLDASLLHWQAIVKARKTTP